ncbi:hypothetical protein [Pseudotabrizicola algicola]|uniref:Uncharacterized protein n=1 Tax=Pseudotabrizicola algicola TaxID=2709381 RepID=A0A6B3RQ27_9RHOB|nr:hypothetical protein [Pseudotabrizicola algicola]NEX45219.1 hypothetical protein [Pseudotabrizicola algicola]
MRKPMPAPARTPQPPEAIRATFDRLSLAAVKHLPFGTLTKADRAGLLKRTAQLCGVSIDKVKEVCNG